MTPTEIVSVLIAVGSVVGMFLTARNAARQTDLQGVKDKAEAVARNLELRDEFVSREFTRLGNEIGRLEEMLDRRRKDIERLFSIEAELRKAQTLLTEENAELRRKDAESQKRISDLEKQVRELLDERSTLIAALEKAGIRVAANRRRGDLGGR